MRRRHIVISLPGMDYQRLVQLAEREERAVDQQASFLLRRVLAESDGATAPTAVQEGGYASA